ncbi:MAG: S-layer homology domain-containing protein [Oscillospiraceae bacterium]|nr:S-layer homology domain-containing protein [Oscillospiraceae bacterium]
MKRSIKAFAFPLILVCMLFCFTVTAGAAVDLDTFQTPAEASNWERTTSSQEVIDFLKVVAAESDGRIIFRPDEFKTEFGTPIPYMIISDKAPASPAEVDPSKAVVYVNCNIHSGEIEGKESMLIFAREVAQGKHDELLKDLVVVICPNNSPDGNDNLGKNRITTQFTPKLVGTRSEGNGFNINRDMTKLESACSRFLVQIMNDWDPVLFIDAHATDGSYMRHAITYNWGLNAGTDPELLAYNRDVFCSRALREGSYLASKGKVAVPYGNFGYYYSGIVKDGWRTFEDYARYTTNYAGLRNRLALLLEVYSYDEFSVRVDTQYECIYGALQTVAKDKEEIWAMIDAAEKRCAARAVEGIDPEVDIVALNSEMVPMKFEGKDKLTVLSYETDEDGKVIGTRLYDEEGDPYAIEHGKPVDYEVEYWGTFVPTDVEVMGAYYLVDADCKEFIDLMKFHGVEMIQLKKAVTIAAEDHLHFGIESYTSGGAVIDGKARSLYEGHYQTLVKGEWEKGEKEIVIPAGTWVISTAQTLGSFAALMCEPAAVDGGVAWNFFDNYFDAKDGTFRKNYSNDVIAAAGSENEKEVKVSIPILKIPAFDTFTAAELGASKFTDLAENAYYVDAVEWAVENGVTGGNTPSTFNPNGTCTRAQTVTFLWRAAGSPEPKMTENPFTDVSESAYYYKAVLWAAENKITGGNTPTTFNPNGVCTRAQVVTFLHRAAGLPKAEKAAEFTDLTAGTYYVDAVAWAVEKGVTGGNTPTTFNPNGSCTRANIVTFLYRYYK